MREINTTENSTFGGVRIQQTWTGLYALEIVLSKYKPGVIIELGTGYGSLSRFFSMFAPVVTFDIDNTRLKKQFDNITYYNFDVFSNKAKQIIGELIKSKYRIFLFCDGGNKGQEMNLYAPHLKSGDLLFAHDWKEELHIGHITDMICTLRPQKVEEQKMFDELKTKLVGFIMK